MLNGWGCGWGYVRLKIGLMLCTNLRDVFVGLFNFFSHRIHDLISLSQKTRGDLPHLARKGGREQEGLSGLVGCGHRMTAA